jgi:hypothetical protein
VLQQEAAADARLRKIQILEKATCWAMLCNFFETDFVFISAFWSFRK